MGDISESMGDGLSHVTRELLAARREVIQLRRQLREQETLLAHQQSRWSTQLRVRGIAAEHYETLAQERLEQLEEAQMLGHEQGMREVRVLPVHSH